jgi:uncharacterized protein (UPF0332 family)
LLTPGSAPFDPLRFLALAHELGQSNDEHKLRTAVGRAYYAIFLIARDRLSVVAGEKTHKEVFQALERRRKYTLRDQMMRLYELRRVADYEMSPVDPHSQNWNHNWTRHEKLASKLLPEVQRL